MFEFAMPAIPDDTEEVANDAVQLVTVANFNGLCRVIAALAFEGRLSPEQLENIHGAMTTPLDDPDWRDDLYVSGTRDTLEVVLARAVRDARTSRGWKPDPDLILD